MDPPDPIDPMDPPVQPDPMDPPEKPSSSGLEELTLWTPSSVWLEDPGSLSAAIPWAKALLLPLEAILLLEAREVDETAETAEAAEAAEAALASLASAVSEVVRAQPALHFEVPSLLPLCVKLLRRSLFVGGQIDLKSVSRLLQPQDTESFSGSGEGGPAAFLERRARMATLAKVQELHGQRIQMESGEKTLVFKAWPQAESSSGASDPPSLDLSRRPQTDLTGQLLGHLLNPVSGDDVEQRQAQQLEKKLIQEARELCIETGLVQRLMDLALQGDYFAKVDQLWEKEGLKGCIAAKPSPTETSKLSQVQQELKVALEVLQILPSCLREDGSFLQCLSKLAFGALFLFLSEWELGNNAEDKDQLTQFLQDCFMLWERCLKALKEMKPNRTSHWNTLAAWILFNHLDLSTHQEVLERAEKHSVLEITSKLLDLMASLLEDATAFSEDCAVVPPAAFFNPEQLPGSDVLVVALSSLTSRLFSTVVSYGDALSAVASRQAREISSVKSTGSVDESSLAPAASILLSEEEEDGEPLLGNWLFEELPQPITSLETQQAEDRARLANFRSPWEKASPALKLSARIWSFCNTHLTATDAVRKCVKAGITEQVAGRLAQVLLSFSRCDADGGDAGISDVFLPLQEKCNVAVMTLCHNILAFNMLGIELQESFLRCLGLVGHRWPLKVHPNTLSIAAQMLLIQQHRPDKGAPRGKGKAAPNPYVVLWENILNTLVGQVSRTEESGEEEDLNVEHAQFLLFFFHALPLMQKKQILLFAATSLCEASNLVGVKLRNKTKLTKSNLFSITRLVLLFEYQMKNLYEPPPELFGHIKRNLFHKDTPNEISKDSAFFPFTVDVGGKEKNLGKQFYNLFPPAEISQDIPKLDGLAVSFLCASSESLNYNQVYTGLIDLLSILETVCTEVNTNALPLIYASRVTWRTVQSLPPAKQFLLSLNKPSTLSNPARICHALLLTANTDTEAKIKWIQEALIKQGDSKEDAVELVQKVVQMFHNCNTYSMLLNSVLTRHPSELREETPNFSEILSIQLLLVRLIGVRKQRPLLQESSKSELESSSEDLEAVVENTLQMALRTAKNVLLRNVAAVSDAEYDLLHHCLSICNVSSVTNAEEVKIESLLPEELGQGLAQWNESAVGRISESSNLILTVSAALNSLQRDLPRLVALKHCVYLASNLATELVQSARKMKLEDSKTLFNALQAITLDGCTQFLSTELTSVVGNQNLLVFETLLSHSVPLVKSANSFPQKLDIKLAAAAVSSLTYLLSVESGLRALSICVCKGHLDLVEMLLTTVPSSEFTQAVTKFFLVLFEQLGMKEAANSDRNAALQEIVHAMLVSDSWRDNLKNWLKDLCNSSAESRSKLALLHALKQYLLQEKNSTAASGLACFLLLSVVELGSEVLAQTPEGLTFVELFDLMQGFAKASQTGAMHLELLDYSMDWFQSCKFYLEKKDVLHKLEQQVDGGRHVFMVENATCLLKYLSLFLSTLILSQKDVSAPTPGSDAEVETDWADDEILEEEDSAGEESDEEDLCYKLCTYTVTQKEFMNQHWYHCHTCQMIDGIGVCSVCAKVCHANHDLTYSKYGSFFCDCGAKEDGTCQAITKRTAASSLPSALEEERRVAASDSKANGDSSLKGKNWGEGDKKDDLETERAQLANDLALCKPATGEEDPVMRAAQVLIPKLMELLDHFVPIVASVGQRHTWAAHLTNVNEALDVLHTETATKVESSETLVLPTLGSQEGAFENVRMTYSGDQGQTLRQLINAFMVRRVVMSCLLSSSGGGGSKQKQHLAVAHEKGKITILQLSALLKQADSSQKKLTLTRLSSAPIPFTVLSMVPNPLNEEVLAVTGLKECHVVKLPLFGSASGSEEQHIALQPQLDANNFIIKTCWMPGSQTELALITADFVKIYDLSLDIVEPQYWFLVPSGKIRDCTFAFLNDKDHDKGLKYVLIMSSAGHIYSQLLSQESSARHGPFYVTSIMDVKHEALKASSTSSEQISGGGVSIFYYHELQLLFFSYTDGKSFAASLRAFSEEQQLDSVCLIDIPSSGSQHQPLCQWSAIRGHPGLVTAFLQQSNNPVVLMVRDRNICVQEIRSGSKSKIIDMVSLRHVVAGESSRTTLIILCEDGSLKIYMANMDTTSFWLQVDPKPHPLELVLQTKPPRKKRLQQRADSQASAAFHSESVQKDSFPVDFFETCNLAPFNDLEFGGADLLQVYNLQQIKHRLQTSGLYIASTKPTGFTLEVGLSEARASKEIIVGLRVMLGTQDPARVPSFIQIFDRRHTVNLARGRWFDLPISPDESFVSDKKINIYFGPSLDPGGVAMVDSVHVYVKPKDAMGWLEDQEEGTQSKSPRDKSPSDKAASEDQTDNNHSVTSATKEFIYNLAQVLEFYYRSPIEKRKLESFEDGAVKDLISKNFLLPSCESVRQFFDAILASLFLNQAEFHNYRDDLVLKNSFSKLEGTAQASVEQFHQILLACRSVAMSRPANLIKFAQELPELQDVEKADRTKLFVEKLVSLFWKLLQSCPANSAMGTLGQGGLSHVNATVQTLIEILHALTMTRSSEVSFVTGVYVELLLSRELEVSFPAKHALLRALRPKMKKKKLLPAVAPQKNSSTQAPVSAALNDNRAAANIEERLEAAFNLGPGGQGLGGIAGNLEALLPLPDGGEVGGGADNLPLVLDAMAGEVDDEAMVELAIALSLQEQQGEDQSIDDQLQQGLQGLRQGLEQLVNLEEMPALQGLAGVLGVHGAALAHNMAEEGNLGGNHAAAAAEALDAANGHLDRNDDNEPGDEDARAEPREEGGDGGSLDEGPGANSEPAHFSDTTASAPGSDYDDEDDEDEDVSRGRGGKPAEAPPRPDEPPMTKSSESTFVLTEGKTNVLPSQEKQLQLLRIKTLEQLLLAVPRLSDVGGLHCLPFLQVVLMLTAGLESTDDKDRGVLDQLLLTFLKEFRSGDNSLEVRTPRSEMLLVVMRFFSVLMSRSKSWLQCGVAANSKSGSDALGSNFVSMATAKALLKSNCLEANLSVLTELLPYWNGTRCDDKIGQGQILTTRLLKPEHSLPDLSPFFLKQYVKGHAHDVFEAYPQLLTEMALRIPYQVKKVCEGGSSSALDSKSLESKEEVQFNERWFHCLGEYMMSQQTPFVRRQVRKLLLYISGSKEKYRQLRDWHSLASHFKRVQAEADMETFDQLAMPYDKLLSLMEHLKACLDVACSRTANWQKFCLQNEDTLLYLFNWSVRLDEAVCSIILQLLQCAICWLPSDKAAAEKKGEKTKKSSLDKEDHSQEAAAARAGLLIQTLADNLSKTILRTFLEKFLLSSNLSTIRWQAHAILLNLFRHSDSLKQQMIVDALWETWPELPLHGAKAAQFVDLLGYLSINPTKEAKERVKQELQQEENLTSYVEDAMSLLKIQNRTLTAHPNANLYGSVAKFMDLQGFYLESDPCLVCNNPEVPFSSLKLSSLKVDTKFTTTTHIVKLSNSHSIAKIYLRIGDLKRQKMVRTINFFYNTRSVQAVVELKNRASTQWHLAKKITLNAGQTEIKVDFPLPIVACNLKIEYADFFENVSGSTELLQCPRCSASVAANPGVCSNCGENVFQCHKCRIINYDEKDPFLCNACGFCKYAKFEYTLHCRPCCAVDPIESDEDRKKALASINGLLNRADKAYRNLLANRPQLDTMLVNIADAHVAQPAMSPSESGAIFSRNPSLLLQNRAASIAGSAAVPLSNNPVAGSGSVLQGSFVSRNIQELAMKYGGECRALFEELSQIVQKVNVTRKELKKFDESRLPMPHMRRGGETNKTLQSAKKLSQTSNCYGCATFAVGHCLTLLRALATKPKARELLFQQGLIRQLLDHNLRGGSVQTRTEVRKLLTTLTKDSVEATKHLSELVMRRILRTLRSRKHAFGGDLVDSVRDEMALLTNGLLQPAALDNTACWEERVKCVLKLFLFSTKSIRKVPAFVECVTLPCLKILESMMLRPGTKDKGGKKKPWSKSKEEEEKENDMTGIDIMGWLNGKEDVNFANWSSDRTQKQLTAKFFNRWHSRVFKKTTRPQPECSLPLSSSWLKWVLFNQVSPAARQVTCSMIESFAASSFQRKRCLLDLLVSFLPEVKLSSEASQEYFTLLQSLLEGEDFKLYLYLKGALAKIAGLVTEEIERLRGLESCMFGDTSTDLTLGFSLHALVGLLSTFLSVDRIKSSAKSVLLPTVLHSYLCLRQLVVQRTKLIDQAEEKLLQLLEDLTTGTLEETKAFMAICVETIRKCPLEDQVTPVFVFERLCNIIYPEEADTGEFFMVLEKDPNQEDFLQGRMLGNPYSSGDTDLGPLMRQVKNKICRDCELIALLEDDNGMELLVNNKIISLELPVQEVYQKVWVPQVLGSLPTAGEVTEPMRIVYRMRGLLGDATEEFIESLESKDGNEDLEEEETYRLALVLSECEGLQVLLQRLLTIHDASHSRPLLAVLLKLLSFCVKLKSNREQLLEPKLAAIPALLRTLTLCLESNDQESVEPLTEEVLVLMERLLVAAAGSSLDLEHYASFASGGVSSSDLEVLLEHAIRLKAGSHQHLGLMRVLPFLTYANANNMTLLLKHFDDVLHLERFDHALSPEDEQKMEAFVSMMESIECNPVGNTLKTRMLEMGIVERCISHLRSHAPPADATTVFVTKRMEEPVQAVWKEFLSKPSLRYVLRTLAGLATHHRPTQLLISDQCVTVLHQLEQVSSEEHVGSLAETVLEALRDCPEAEQRVVQVREQTKAEKKKLAMAMREKQLKAIGLKANSQGQVKAESSLVEQFAQLEGEEEESEGSLSCNICREGYKYQPTKVLAIYTFTSPCAVEEMECAAAGTPQRRQTLGYSTVSHFNLVHVECHSAAVRQARGREEWESALLQNANTKCNGLLPLWGPQVPESAFASSLARHNTYLAEATGFRDVSYQSSIHDVKLLLLRFAEDRSFSEETGGGGPESNLHTLPYLVHMALYVLNTTRSEGREERNLAAYLAQTPNEWVRNAYVAEGPLYYTVLAMLLTPPDQWKDALREKLFSRLVVMAHVRALRTHPAPVETSDRQVWPYETYRKVALFFSLVDLLYRRFCAVVVIAEGSTWPQALANWIRQNDSALWTGTTKVLEDFQQEMSPAASIEEILDICGLLKEDNMADMFVTSALASVQ